MTALVLPLSIIYASAGKTDAIRKPPFGACSHIVCCQRVALFAMGSFARINSLFRLCGPAAIVRIVMAFIINAINTCSRRAFSHIDQESCKTIAPSSTDFDATSAIVFKDSLFGIVTALLHAQPRPVSRCFLVSPTTMTVFDSRTVFSQASTTKAMAATQVMGFDPSRIAALTSAKPVNLGSSANLSWADNSPTTKYFSNQIHRFHHVDRIEKQRIVQEICYGC